MQGKYVREVLHGVGSGVIAYTLYGSYFENLSFTGPSMEPTILENDIGLSEKFTPYSKLKRGDIVTAISPDNPSMIICKRIIALEGDKVSYTPTSVNGDGGMIKIRRFVPRGHVWVEGDNSSMSHDSRAYGPMPLGLIRSRVFAKVYPFRNFTWFSRASEDS